MGESHRLGLDPEDVERRIGPRTRAMVVVHLWGMPSRMTELGQLAKRHDLKIVEDASHAHGAVWRGQPCGGLGDISVFSLQGDKLAPAGEGGVLLCSTADQYERATLTHDVHRVYALETAMRRFAATGYGLKARIAPLSAALGLSQFKRLDEHNRMRRAAWLPLAAALADLGFHCFDEPSHVERVWFECLISVPDESRLPMDLLVKALQAEGCQVAAPRYPLLHQQPLFREGVYQEILRCPDARDLTQVALPQTEAANQKLLRLPTFASPDTRLVEQYAMAFKRVMTNQDHILAAQ